MTTCTSATSCRRSSSRSRARSSSPRPLRRVTTRTCTTTRGSPDIFMNILSTNGFVGRFITDWAGPDAVLKSVKIRLGAPNHPGDTMTMTGKVTAKDNGLVEVEVRGANSRGDHVTGTVALELPVRAAP